MFDKIKLNQNFVIFTVIFLLFVLFVKSCSTEQKINKQIEMLSTQNEMINDISLKNDSLKNRIIIMKEEQSNIANLILLSSTINAKNKEIVRLKRNLLNKK